MVNILSSKAPENSVWFAISRNNSDTQVTKCGHLQKLREINLSASTVQEHTVHCFHEKFSFPHNRHSYLF